MKLEKLFDAIYDRVNFSQRGFQNLVNNVTVHPDKQRLA
jgi:hypothetical protein